MPLGKNNDGTYRVFWEETSLCGRGDRMLTFEECKKRAYERLGHYGINVMDVEEEEYCYIPMGGELPDLNQRMIAFGGAANLVHPSTGYHVCRMLAASTDLAKVIGKGIKENHAADRIAADSYRALWNQKNRNQRDFQAFGGDFLMAQRVKSLRGFFSAFFSIDLNVWSGFLAGWPGLPGNFNHESWDRRLGFALTMFTKMPNETRLAIILFAITYTLEYGPGTLLRSLTPSFLFGQGPPELDWQPPLVQMGNIEVKEEAKVMMKMFVESKMKENKAFETNIPVENKEIIYPAPFN